MPRDDDDDDDRPRRKSSRDDDEQNEEVEDDDRPRKKSARDREDDADADDSAGKKGKPMPVRLIGAIIAAMAWGILTLHGSCLQSSHSILGVIQMHEVQNQQAKMREDMRRIGINPGDMGLQAGLPYTMLGAHVFLFLMSALLLAGGIALLMRKGFGKYLAMGAPVGMVLVEVVGLGICLVVTRGVFLASHNIGFLINMLFSFVVAGSIIFLLLNKDVSKALK